MALPDAPYLLFRELGERYEKLGQQSMRDRFYLLAADAAFQADQVVEGERLRLKILQHNPGHLLRPFSSFREARESPDVQLYLADLRNNYPIGLCTQMLDSMKNGTSAPPHPHQAKEPTPSSAGGRSSAVPVTAPVLDWDVSMAMPSSSGSAYPPAAAQPASANKPGVRGESTYSVPRFAARREDVIPFLPVAMEPAAPLAHSPARNGSKRPDSAPTMDARVPTVAPEDGGGVVQAILVTAVVVLAALVAFRALIQPVL